MMRISPMVVESTMRLSLPWISSLVHPAASAVKIK